METIRSHRPIPVHPGLPLVGNTFEYLRDPLALIRRLQRDYGDQRVVQISVGGRVTHLLLKPEESKQVLQENNRNYGRGKSFEILRQFLGNGLLTSEGDFWRRQRRLAQPAFHRQRLVALAEAMIDEAQAWVDRLAQIDRRRPVNVSQATTDATLRIVTRTLFGSNLDNGVDEMAIALSRMNRVANSTLLNPIKLPKWIPTPDSRAFDKALKQVNDLIFGIIEQRRQSGERREDLLDMLLFAVDEETGETMSNDQLRDEMVTLFVAGYETTATSTAWTLYLLAQHPDVTARLKDELRRVLGERNRPTAEDLRNLPYLTQVISESLRLYPPAWVMSRLSLGPDRLGEYVLPARQGVLVSPYALHHDPASWPDPERFDPDRFAPEQVKNRHPYAYVPFGGGPRLCIGNQFAILEMQSLLTALLRRYDLKPAWAKAVRTYPLITLRPRRPIEIMLE